MGKWTGPVLRQWSDNGGMAKLSTRLSLKFTGQCADVPRAGKCKWKRKGGTCRVLTNSELRGPKGSGAPPLFRGPLPCSPAFHRGQGGVPTTHLLTSSLLAHLGHISQPHREGVHPLLHGCNPLGTWGPPGVQVGVARAGEGSGTHPLICEPLPSSMHPSPSGRGEAPHCKS